MLEVSIQIIKLSPTCPLIGPKLSCCKASLASREPSTWPNWLVGGAMCWGRGEG